MYYAVCSMKLGMIVPVGDFTEGSQNLIEATLLVLEKKDCKGQ